MQTILHKLIFILFLLINMIGVSQKIPDSLKNRSYVELDSLYNKEWNDTLIASTYAKAYLLKAKEENDSIEIADAYVKLGEISKIERGLKYADSILLITKNSPHKSYPARAHVLKSYLFYNNGNYLSLIHI